MVQPIRVLRLTEQEGQKLQRILRRGSTSTVPFRRALFLPASAGRNSQLLALPALVRAVERNHKAAEERLRLTETRVDPLLARGAACWRACWVAHAAKRPTEDGGCAKIRTRCGPTRLRGRGFHHLPQVRGGWGCVPPADEEPAGGRTYPSVSAALTRPRGNDV